MCRDIFCSEDVRTFIFCVSLIPGLLFIGLYVYKCCDVDCNAEDCTRKKDFGIYYDRSFESFCESKHDCYCDNGYGYIEAGDCYKDPLSNNQGLCIFYTILSGITIIIG